MTLVPVTYKGGIYQHDTIIDLIEDLGGYIVQKHIIAAEVVLQCFVPREDIGLETHADTDQFIRVEEGTGKAILDGQEYRLKAGSAIVIPAGTEHNVINTSSKEALKLYTLYTPPEHADGTIHKTKAEAEAAEHH